MLSLYLDQSGNKKILQIRFEFAYLSFFLTQLELKRWIRSYTPPVVPSKTVPVSSPKWATCIPAFRPKRRKNPTRWANTYLYSLYEGVPRGQVLHCLFKKEFRGHFLRLYYYFGLKLLLSFFIFSSEHKDIVQSGCRGYNYSVCLSATEAWLHIWSVRNCC